MGVIEFKKSEPEKVCDPHMSGYAICSACRHEWMAVVPAGYPLFQCPECLTEKGRMQNPCMPSDGVIWQCSCECDLFRITGRGTMCINCGKYQNF